MRIIGLNRNSSRTILRFETLRRWGTGLSGSALPVLFIGILIVVATEADALDPVRMGTSMTDIVVGIGQGRVAVPMAPTNPLPVVRVHGKPSARPVQWTNEAKAAPGSKQSPQAQGPSVPRPGVRATALGTLDDPERRKAVRAVSITSPAPVTGLSRREPTNLHKKVSNSNSIRSPQGNGPTRIRAHLVKASPASVVSPLSAKKTRPKGIRIADKKSDLVPGPRFKALEPALSGRGVSPSRTGPRVKAKALLCVDCSSNKVVLAENEDEPLPIASISKLLTAMIVIDRLDLDKMIKVPWDIMQVPRHRVGIKPGESFTVRDLLHGLLIESGNDCAEVLARAYPRGGRYGFISEMNKLAVRLGASHTKLYTPSGLDTTLILGRKGKRDMEALRSNVATAEDVALIARQAFQYPLIRRIAAMKTYSMHARSPKAREYRLATNDKLLYGNLPVAGAKTGYTNLAGRCIVALFKNEGREHVVVVLNTPKHFKAAEKIYRWASKSL